MYTFLEIGYLVRVNTADLVPAKHRSPSFVTKPVDIWKAIGPNER